MKKANSSIDMGQLDKYTNVNNKNYFNYDNKQIIYYIGENIDMTDNNVAKKINALKKANVIVVNSLKELRGVLK